MYYNVYSSYIAIDLFIVCHQIPVTREVLSALPTILSALCLNARGLNVFIEVEPFDHLFGILITPEYLPAMRRKRGNDQIGKDLIDSGAKRGRLRRRLW